MARAKANGVTLTTVSADQQAKITEAVLREGAARAERAAYIAECDVDLYAAVEKSGPVVLREGARARLADLGQTAPTLRRKADRKAARAKLSDIERAAIAREFLTEWLGNVEREIVAHTALRDDRRAALDATGADALDADERTEVEAHLGENESALATLTTAHKVATARLAALPTAPSGT